MPELTKNLIVYCNDDCGTWSKFKRMCPLANGMKVGHIMPDIVGKTFGFPLTYSCHCLGTGELRWCPVSNKRRFNPNINMDVDVLMEMTERYIKSETTAPPTQYNTSMLDDEDGYEDEGDYDDEF